MYKNILNMAQKIKEAKAAFYEAHALSCFGQLVALCEKADIKLADAVRTVAGMENTAAENLLSTFMYVMDGDAADYSVEYEVDSAIETTICLEEEEDGITAYCEQE